eukprot:TRINITY_DN4367_c0_g1_i1.p1 TRINITY_DN4367_c0_g1~~TRINITY_DN4367_c0_g1_i1.p1  ORF type:complete len:898 (+),score=175.40 TRINITY_DN4367_c0_g1_i1:691-3384(+)
MRIVIEATRKPQRKPQKEGKKKKKKKKKKKTMTSVKQKQTMYDVGSGVFGALFQKDTSAAAKFVESAKKELSLEQFKESLSEVGIAGLVYKASNGSTFLCNLFETSRSVKDRYRDEVIRDILKAALAAEQEHTKDEESSLLLMTNSDGNTPLMMACKNEDAHQDTIKVLIDKQPKAVFIQNNKMRIKIEGSKEQENVGILPIHAALHRSRSRTGKDKPDHDEIVRMLFEVNPNPACYTCCTPAPEDSYRYTYAPSDIFCTSLLQDLLPMNKSSKYWHHSGTRDLKRFFEIVPKVFSVELELSTWAKKQLIEKAVAEQYGKTSGPMKYFRKFEDATIPEYEPKMSSGQLPGAEEGFLKWNGALLSVEDPPTGMYVGATILHSLFENLTSDSVDMVLPPLVDAMLKIKVISDSVMTKDNNGKFAVEVLMERCSEMDLSDYQKEYPLSVAKSLLYRMSLSWFDSLTEEEKVPFITFMGNTEKKFESQYAAFINKREVDLRNWRPPSKFENRVDEAKSICFCLMALGLVGGIGLLFTSGVAVVGHIITYLSESSLGTFEADFIAGSCFLSSIGIALCLKNMAPSARKSGLKELKKAEDMWNSVAHLKPPTKEETTEVSYSDGNVWKTSTDPLYVSLRPSAEEKDDSDDKKSILTARSGELIPYPGAKILTSPITKSKCLAYSCYLDATYEEKEGGKDGKWVKQSRNLAEADKQLPLLLQGVLIKDKLSLDGCCSYCENVEKMDPKDWYANVTEVHTENEDCFKDLVTLPWGSGSSMLSSYESFEEAWKSSSPTRNHAVRVREFILKPTARCSIIGFAGWNSYWKIPEIETRFSAPQYGVVKLSQSGDEATDDRLLSSCFNAFKKEVNKAKNFLNCELPALTVGGALLSCGLLVLAFKRSFV